MNRLVSGILLILLLACISMLSFHIQPAEAAPTGSVETETFDGGIVEWTTSESHSGSSCVKLSMPTTALYPWGWASVKVPCDNSLDSLVGADGQADFSFFVKFGNAVPRYVIYLDNSVVLMSDYSDIGSNAWTEGKGGLRWNWTKYVRGASWGMVWDDLRYWSDTYPERSALFVGVALEYNAVDPLGFGESLYVDEVIVNGVSYDLEENGVFPLYGMVDFSHFPETSWVSEVVLFNGTEGYDSYTWDFGDGNHTTLLEPMVNHTYSSTGNYNVTLNVTKYSLWKVTSYQITVTSTSDLNKGGTVNIVDVTMVALAYQSAPGDPNWNSVADLDGNGIINIVDITLVAKDYGKTV